MPGGERGLAVIPARTVFDALQPLL
jgi:hypothetical protein